MNLCACDIVSGCICLIIDIYDVCICVCLPVYLYPHVVNILIQSSKMYKTDGLSTNGIVETNRFYERLFIHLPTRSWKCWYQLQLSLSCDFEIREKVWDNVFIESTIKFDLCILGALTHHFSKQTSDQYGPYT